MQTLAPANEAEVAAMVADAAASKTTLQIEGNASKRGLGRPVDTDAVLNLSGVSGIVSYEPEELVITARPGTRLEEIERTLARQKQCLAFEPNRWSLSGTATIGGTVAAGVAGSRRVVLGGARDHLIGFRAVNGEGQSFKAGGKVVKNVTGYDLPKLAAGSFGTLFAMTELTLRTYPHAGMPLTLVAENLDVDAGCALMRRVAGSRFEATGFCYLPRTAIERMDLDLSAGGQRPVSLTLVRFEGTRESVEVRSNACGKELGVASTTLSGSASDELWRKLQQLKAFDAARIVWRISLPPSAAIGAISALAPECFVADWAGGLLWIEPGARSPADVHAVAQSFGGHAMLFRGPDEMRRGNVFQPLDAVTAALTTRLKAAFDPLGVFNPGRMYDGI